MDAEVRYFVDFGDKGAIQSERRASLSVKSKRLHFCSFILLLAIWVVARSGHLERLRIAVSSARVVIVSHSQVGICAVKKTKSWAKCAELEDR